MPYLVGKLRLSSFHWCMATNRLIESILRKLMLKSKKIEKWPKYGFILSPEGCLTGNGNWTEGLFTIEMCILDRGKAYRTSCLSKNQAQLTLGLVFVHQEQKLETVLLESKATNLNTLRFVLFLQKINILWKILLRNATFMTNIYFVINLPVYS